MKFFLGVDVGASKTHALIADENGRSAGFGRAGGGCYQSVGVEGLMGAMKEAVEGARRMAGVALADVAGAGFGIAGYDFPSERGLHLEAISSLGLSCPVDVVNDGVNGLLAGATRGVGVNVTAGTSVNCRGRGPDGREGRVVGNGMDFGEFGGGSEIVWKGLHMVSHAWSRRIPPTALTRIYLEACGAKNELELVEGISSGRYRVAPAMAVKIFGAARAGDAAACEVIRWAGGELGWLAVSVIRQIGMENDAVEVVQSGSAFDGGEWITRPMREIVLAHAPSARLIRLDCPPVVGPVLLGMETAGLNGYAVRKTIVETTSRILGEG